MLLRPLRFFALLFGLSVLLSACAKEPPPAHLPEMQFSTLHPWSLNVGRIEVVSKVAPSNQPPHIEYDMPVAPENALRRWVQDRLRPVGRSGTLRVLIRNASATELFRPTDKSMSGMFKKEENSRIDMALEASLQILDERQFVVTEINASVNRSQTTLEGMKLSEHDRLLYTMVHDLVEAYGKEVEPQISTTFGRWVEP